MLRNGIPLSGPLRNKLLAALPAADWKRVQPNLEPIEVTRGATLCESNACLGYAYFPTTAIVSLMYGTVDGASTEIAAVGNEGFAGVTLLMGGAMTPNRVVVQSKGWLYRLNAEILKEEFARGGWMQHLLLRYMRALLTLMGQTAVCGRHHSVFQQVCRWLLLSSDRVASPELLITHEWLSHLLGVRREGVTDSLRQLQSSGLLASTHRGHITIVDRAGIEARCCECYGVVRREFDHLLGLAQYSPYKLAFSSAIDDTARLCSGVECTCAMAAV